VFLIRYKQSYAFFNISSLVKTQEFNIQKLLTVSYLFSFIYLCIGYIWLLDLLGVLRWLFGELERGLMLGASGQPH
jgi:hypothetical protein